MASPLSARRFVHISIDMRVHRSIYSNVDSGYSVQSANHLPSNGSRFNQKSPTDSMSVVFGAATKSSHLVKNQSNTSEVDLHVLSEPTRPLPLTSPGRPGTTSTPIPTANSNRWKTKPQTAAIGRELAAYNEFMRSHCAGHATIFSSEAGWRTKLLPTGRPGFFEWIRAVSLAGYPGGHTAAYHITIKSHSTRYVDLRPIY